MTQQRRPLLSNACHALALALLYVTFPTGADIIPCFVLRPKPAHFRCHQPSTLWRDRRSRCKGEPLSSCRTPPLRGTNSDGEDEEKNISKLNESKWRNVMEKWNPTKLSVNVDDVRLLRGDVLTLLVVALLLGFTDAISDPSFVANGGFAAPIPAVPPTLGTLTGRLSEMGLAWVLSSLKNDGYSRSATVTDESAVKCAFATWIDHCSIRIIVSLLIAGASHSPVDAIDLFRQLWFTLPVMTAFRVVYGRGNF